MCPPMWSLSRTSITVVVEEDGVLPDVVDVVVGLAERRWVARVLGVRNLRVERVISWDEADIVMLV